MLANYGLDTLRFVKPVGIGDTIQARPTCKRKIDRPARKGQPPQGVVAWEVQVTNQDGELTVASGFGIDFIAPARLGDLLTARCAEVSKAGRTGVYDVEVRPPPAPA